MPFLADLMIRHVLKADQYIMAGGWTVGFMNSPGNMVLAIQCAKVSRADLLSQRAILN